MAEEKLETILQNYRRDGEDYAELFETMTKFQKTLDLTRPDSENPKAFMEKTDGDKGKEYIDNLSAYRRYREERVDEILKRSEESAQLCRELCRDYGLSQFNVETLRRSRKFAPARVTQLEEQLNHLTATMEKVIELDQKITEQLKMDYSSAKLQIQRLQGRQKVRNAYQSGPAAAAYFIDKNK